MFKKHRQDCKYPKSSQFDIYPIISLTNFNCNKSNHKKTFHENQSLKRIDTKVTLLLRYQFSCFIKDFTYSKEYFSLLIFQVKNGIRQEK